MRVGFTLMRDGPFVLGGNHRWQPTGTSMVMHGPHPLGRGYEGYVVFAPSGTTFVAEAATGAFIGPTLEDVRADIAAADPKVCEQQMEDAREMRKEVRLIDQNEFWKKLKCAAPGAP